MTEGLRGEATYYNLDGGQRHLVMQGGTVKAVAPGLRLVEATEEEKRLLHREAARGLREYGLPV